MSIIRLGDKHAKRYSVVVARLTKLKRAKTTRERKEKEQITAVESWLACSSKVVLLNHEDQVPHIKAKLGLEFDHRFAENPTMGNALRVLVEDTSNIGGFGAIVVDGCVLDVGSAERVDGVRVAAQLSRAWAATAVLTEVIETKQTGVSPGWFVMSHQVGKYLLETIKNPPAMDEADEWVPWLNKELRAKVMGHRYFDASIREIGWIVEGTVSQEVKDEFKLPTIDFKDAA